MNRVKRVSRLYAEQYQRPDHERRRRMRLERERKKRVSTTPKLEVVSKTRKRRRLRSLNPAKGGGLGGQQALQASEEVWAMTQITLRQLLKDPTYKRWFCKEPKMKMSLDLPPSFRLGWRVYAQKHPNGSWARRDFQRWRDAYRFLAKHIRKWHDAALVSRVEGFRPPVVVTAEGTRRYHIPEAEDHRWCTHCRRPTVWGYFKIHHAFTGHFKPTPTELRCSVCGIRWNYIKHYS